METNTFLQLAQTATGVLVVSGLIATLGFLASMFMFSLMKPNPNRGLLHLTTKTTLLAGTAQVFNIITFIALFVFVMKLIDIV